MLRHLDFQVMIGQSMNETEILNRAAETIAEREQTYGDASINLERAAAGCDVIARAALENGGRITAAHLVLIQDWLKTCRLLETMGHEDSWVDKVGYSAIGGRIATEMGEDT